MIQPKNFFSFTYNEQQATDIEKKGLSSLAAMQDVYSRISGGV